VRLPTAIGSEQAKFTAYAFNEDRIKSETATSAYTRPQMKPQPSRTFVIAIGIDNYAEKRLRLNFAADDARLFGARLANLPRGEKTRLVVLADDSSAPGQATRAAIRDVIGILGGSPRMAALARLKKLGVDASALDQARPDDTVILTFSGHGWANAAGNFYLLPADAKWPDETAPPDTTTLISTTEMTRLLRRIDAGEMALIIDACHSAASVDAGGFRAGPMGDAGLGQLAFDKGIRILTATQADDVALESPELGQGLLTYALAQDGLAAAKADLDGNGQINLDEWLRYAVQRLPVLSSEVALGKYRGVAPAWRGFVLSDEFDSRPSLQEPSLFDFTDRPSTVVLVVQRP
jgi:uncharacterized caspase-like protein